MITAKIVAHSQCINTGKEIVTFELEYQRFIHGEFMTHRAFSRNAASSRAIPVDKMLSLVANDPALPIHWGKNQTGMQAKQQLSWGLRVAAEFLWKRSAKAVAKIVRAMSKLGLHKQVANRLLEPYQNIKVVVTYTEGDNFYWLRNHEDAQPEIAALAQAMLHELDRSIPVVLEVGEWHTPYFGDGYWAPSMETPLQIALKISSSCCAQTSYRKTDDTVEKAEMVYARLVESEPVHASPFEHQATPIPAIESGCFSCKEWPEGVTHVDRDGKYWSGNFQGWIQHRQLIPNNVYNGEV